MHKISDEFEFRPDRTTDYGVSCLWASKKFPIDLQWENGVAMLARSFFIKSPSKLLVIRTGIRAWSCSILGRIRPLILELLALEWRTFHTFELEYLWSQLVNLDQILCVAALGWGEGCIRFCGRLDHSGERSLPFGLLVSFSLVILQMQTINNYLQTKLKKKSVFPITITSFHKILLATTQNIVYLSLRYSAVTQRYGTYPVVLYCHGETWCLSLRYSTDTKRHGTCPCGALLSHKYGTCPRGTLLSPRDTVPVPAVLYCHPETRYLSLWYSIVTKRRDLSMWYSVGNQRHGTCPCGTLLY